MALNKKKPVDFTERKLLAEYNLVNMGKCLAKTIQESASKRNLEQIEQAALLTLAAMAELVAVNLNVNEKITEVFLTVLFKVSKLTKPGRLAGAIVHALNENGGKDVVLQAIGAGAVNQAVKAVAIARRMVDGEKEICVVPGFCDAVIDGREVTTMSLKLAYNS